VHENPFVRFLLVRHGQHETAGMASQDDTALTAQGREQVARLVATLQLDEADVLFTSPLRRAQETAAAFERPFATLDDLREFELGPGHRTEEVVAERLDLQLWRPHHGFPGGETLGAFQMRVTTLLEELAGAHVGRRVVAATHSGVLDAAVRWAYGATLETPWTTESTLPNASITEILHWPDGRFEDGAPRFTHLHRLGDVSHLPPELVSEI
jgi:broad specificity phosphatase PhoE